MPLPAALAWIPAALAAAGKIGTAATVGQGVTLSGLGMQASIPSLMQMAPMLAGAAGMGGGGGAGFAPASANPAGGAPAIPGAGGQSLANVMYLQNRGSALGARRMGGSPGGGPVDVLGNTGGVSNFNRYREGGGVGLRGRGQGSLPFSPPDASPDWRSGIMAGLGNLGQGGNLFSAIGAGTGAARGAGNQRAYHGYLDQQISMIDENTPQQRTDALMAARYGGAALARPPTPALDPYALATHKAGLVTERQQASRAEKAGTPHERARQRRAQIRLKIQRGEELTDAEEKFMESFSGDAEGILELMFQGAGFSAEDRGDGGGFGTETGGGQP